MITQRIDPLDFVSIVPPRRRPSRAQAEPGSAPRPLRRNDALPFADVLTEARIRDVLNEHGVTYRDRVFDPVTTIWGFLSQVLSDDHCCRDAVSRIIAHRAASGLETCSPNTASYCNARGRLATAVLRTLARRTAAELQAAADAEWKWNGRSVFIADGSHVSMPDTPENQASLPATAGTTARDRLPAGPSRRAAFAGDRRLPRPGHRPVRGQGDRRDHAPAGDVRRAEARRRGRRRRPVRQLLPRLRLRERGSTWSPGCRRSGWGAGRWRPGPMATSSLWQRPNKPRGMTGEQYRRYPKSLLMRQVTVDARDRDNRAEQFKVVTTMLDASIDGGQIGDLYERRWSGEVDIRSIKSTMQMDVLRCKTPEMVHKEIWAHLLAYNLLRTVMAVAAAEHGIEPRQVSFKGAKQAVTAFAPKIEAARPEDRPALIDALLAVIAYHRVGDRPGRWEPRARKRRPKPGARLHEPRAAAKQPKDRSKWF